MQNTHQPRATFRQWTITTVYRECGVVTDIIRQTVTLARGQAGITATVDGEAADLERATRLLRNADRAEVTGEILEQAAAA